MQLDELKKELRDYVLNEPDEAGLYSIKAYIAQLRAQKNDWWDLVPREDQNRIEKALHQLEMGEGIPHQEVQKKIRALLSNG
jgi:ABC-type cobalamin/Fe3+-siderophores transport system ATPase subunit